MIWNRKALFIVTWQSNFTGVLWTASKPKSVLLSFIPGIFFFACNCFYCLGCKLSHRLAVWDNGKLSLVMTQQHQSALNQSIQIQIQLNPIWISDSVFSHSVAKPDWGWGFLGFAWIHINPRTCSQIGRKCWGNEEQHEKSLGVCSI